MLTAPALASDWRPFTVQCHGRALLATFAGTREVLSWAIQGGGRRQAPAVAWVEVNNAELPLEVDPRRLLQERLAALGQGQAVGFLTSRRLDRFHQAAAASAEVAAQALATVGLSNALRVGDPPGPLAVATPVGTINVLCELSVPLNEEAALEALSLAVEARTAAVIEAGFPSRRSGEVATGTGTDCLALAWQPGARAERYAGKHTALGQVVGEAVYQAVRAGVRTWLDENGAPAR